MNQEPFTGEQKFMMKRNLTARNERSVSQPQRNRLTPDPRDGNPFRQADLDGRWMYLVQVAERIANIRRAGRLDEEAVLGEIETDLIGLNEVFSREIDPVSDIEGYAVRRLSQEFLDLIKSLHSSQKDRR